MSVQSEINRIQKNVSDTLSVIAETGVSVPEGANSDDMPALAAALAGQKLDKTGDGSDVTAAFTQAASRANIATGEKLSVIFGKLAKWFADLKTVAFTGSYSDLSNKPDLTSYAAKPTVRTLTLSTAGWVGTSKTQTVTCSGVSASETAQLITPVPALASQTAYYKAGILCTGQAANSLTFTCTTVPTEDLTVYVVIQEVTQG